MSRRAVFDSVKRATVAIVAENVTTARHPLTIIGSGFCVDPSGIVVTCRHVIEEFMATSIQEQIKNATGQKTTDGRELLAPTEMLHIWAVFYSMISDSKLLACMARITHVVCKTDRFDLAVLRINWDRTAFPNGHPTVEIASPGDVNDADEIGTCGFPLGTELTDVLGTATSSFTRGIVSSIVPAAGTARNLITGFQLDLGATHGNSGGPVFFWESGRVFGVLDSGVAHLSHAQPLYPLLDDTALMEQMKAATPGKLP